MVICQTKTQHFMLNTQQAHQATQPALEFAQKNVAKKVLGKNLLNI